MFSSSLLGLTALMLATMSHAQNCVLTVPPNPLSAKGLATPYQMSGCNQIDFSNQGSFVEASILDPATGAVQVYNPLVVNKGAAVGKDFIAPVTPKLPANAVVGIWFGSNAVTLTLAGATGGCVNGLGNSIFGQFAHCNGPEFFKAAQTAISKGLLKVPSPGNISKGGSVGSQCPTTRDFRVVDMDQSDNVDSTYLLINKKVLAQNTAANAKANKGAEELTNGSDNALINDFLAPTLGCTVFTAPCITCPTGQSASLALNELQANQFPPSPPALVPLNDDFTVITNNGKVTQSLTKTNLYRAGVGQPDGSLASASGTTYCQQYAASGIFIAANQQLFEKSTSPAPATANNLFTFLANRFATSFGPVPSLGCQDIFGLKTSPVVQKTDGNGVVVSATIDTATLKNILSGKTAPASGKAAGAGKASKTTSSVTASATAKAKGGKKAGTGTGAAKASGTTSAAASAPAKLGTGQTKNKAGSKVGARSVRRHRMLREGYGYAW